MKKSRLVSCLIRVCLILSLLGAVRAGAVDFPPITAEERSLTSVPGEPNAPSVVLFKKGELRMAGYGLQLGNLETSTLHVQVRRKILTEQGKGSGEITILHSDFERLHGFQGRTVLPDGRVIPVPSDAKFLRKVSRSQGTFVTAVAFPAVQVGAILDYDLELKFDSLYFLEPWYFSEDVPVRYSEIEFKAPSQVAVQSWSHSPPEAKIQMSKLTGSPLGWTVKAWVENLPTVPSDPYGPPYQDLAAQMMLLPSAWIEGTAHDPLMESWPVVCKVIGGVYDQVRKRDSGVARKAQETAASGTPRQKSEALYRFVRDRIETEPSGAGALLDPEASLGKVLAAGRGDRAEKALLLQAMLKAVKIDSRLVWAGDRARGAIDPRLPNPSWFDAVFVMLEVDGKRVFLDPSDGALGFGQLRYGYEGTQALLHDEKKPEWIVLPETPGDQNVQRAEIDLALDDKGRLAGTGSLVLTGHHAWERIHWQNGEAQTLAAWQEWLQGRYHDFRITNVKAVERPDERKVTVTWSMAQAADEALGDEASLTAAAPLGPVEQPLVQPASQRRTGVALDYLERSEVELHLRWPAGWKIESLPGESTLIRAAGTLETSAERKEVDRTLVFIRRLDLTRRTFNTTQDYEAIRSLFGELEKSDSQKVVLVRP